MEDIALYNDVVGRAVQMEKINKDYPAALVLYYQARTIDSSDPKLDKRIKKLQKRIHEANARSKENSSNSSNVGPKKNTSIVKEYNRCVAAAQTKERCEHSYQAALALYQKALKLDDTDPNLQKKIRRMVKKLGSGTVVAEQIVAKATKNENESNTVGPFVRSSDSSEPMYYLAGGFLISAKLHDRLYPHQRMGVVWLWELFRKNSGGILADDMGLGKTFQVTVFLAGLFERCRAQVQRHASESASGSDVCDRYQQCKQRFHHSSSSGDPFLSSCTATSPICPPVVLVIAPVSVVPTWREHLEQWLPQVRVFEFMGANKRKRDEQLRQAVTSLRGGVLLTTYGLVSSNAELFACKGMASQAQKEHDWTCVILDEGHRIKNPATKISKAMRSIRAQQRLVLSGTPVQNNLDELWALLDFACTGKVLGDRKTFDAEIASRIIAGQHRTASARQKQVGEKASKALRDLLAPYVLQRKKKDVIQQQQQEEQQKNEQAQSSDQATLHDKVSDSVLPTSPAAATADLSSSAKGMAGMGRKIELTVWVRLSKQQEHMYRRFLQGDQVKNVLRSITGKQTYKSPLAAITTLRKICWHPLLLETSSITGKSVPEKTKQKSRNIISLDDSDSESDIDIDTDQSDASMNHPSEEFSGNYDSAAALLSYPSGKLLTTVLLCSHLTQRGHKILVFSQSKRLLDLLSHSLTGTDPTQRLGAPPMPHLRLDSSVKKPEDRQRRIAMFNTNQRRKSDAGSTIQSGGDGGDAVSDRLCATHESMDYNCFLLTTGVGGVGITLTAADRVIILDPSWNPAVDDQAIDRAYRIGQQKDVVVYRLITCATVEEVMYRKQVFKDGLIRSVTVKPEDDSNVIGGVNTSRCGVEKSNHKEWSHGQRQNDGRTRYFDKQELCEMFSLPEGFPFSSELCKRLQAEHPVDSSVALLLAEAEAFPGVTSRSKKHSQSHLQFLQSGLAPFVYGLSRHDQLYTGKLHTKEHSDMDDATSGHTDIKVQVASVEAKIEEVRLGTERLALTLGPGVNVGTDADFDGGSEDAHGKSKRKQRKEPRKTKDIEDEDEDKHEDKHEDKNEDEDKDEAEDEKEDDEGDDYRAKDHNQDQDQEQELYYESDDVQTPDGESSLTHHDATSFDGEHFTERMSPETKNMPHHPAQDEECSKNETLSDQEDCDEQYWQCTICTYNNLNLHFLRCEVCGAERMDVETSIKTEDKVSNDRENRTEDQILVPSKTRLKYNQLVTAAFTLEKEAQKRYSCDDDAEVREMLKLALGTYIEALELVHVCHTSNPALEKYISSLRNPILRTAHGAGITLTLAGICTGPHNHVAYCPMGQ